MNLEHFGESRQLSRDAVVGRTLDAPDRDERQHRAIEDDRIQSGGIASDDSPCFEFADAFEDCRGSEAYSAGNIGLCLTGIILKFVQY